MSESIKKSITAAFENIFKEQYPQKALPELADATVLLETGLDSLGFAVLVVHLEEVLGFDPFVLSDKPYYPRTFGEFVAFYEANQPK